MVSIDLHNVKKIEKNTRIYDTFTCIKLIITDAKGNETEVKLFNNDGSFKNSQIIQIDNGIEIINS